MVTIVRGLVEVLTFINSIVTIRGLIGLLILKTLTELYIWVLLPDFFWVVSVSITAYFDSSVSELVTLLVRVNRIVHEVFYYQKVCRFFDSVNGIVYLNSDIRDLVGF